MSKIRFVVASLVVTGTFALTASVNATSIAHVNYVTFSAPVALPGVSLPAGTYVFETPLFPSSIDIVRVSSRDRQRVYLTAFTQTVRRPAGRASTATIAFGEGAPGAPQPVKIWYPVGESIGHEFTH